MMKVNMTKDKATADKILDGLRRNGGYCPCRIVQNSDNKCMCKSFRDQIARGESGPCHCGLWVAEEES